MTATTGRMYVGDYIGPFGIGDLVHTGPNLPHHWISDVANGEVVEERCLILQFTAEFMGACMAMFPELRFLQPLLAESFRGVRFPAALAERIRSLMHELLDASGARRLALFMNIADLLGHAQSREPLAGIGFQPDPHDQRVDAPIQLVKRRRYGCAAPALSGVWKRKKC